VLARAEAAAAGTGTAAAPEEGAQADRGTEAGTGITRRPLRATSTAQTARSEELRQNRKRAAADPAAQAEDAQHRLLLESRRAEKEAARTEAATRIAALATTLGVPLHEATERATQQQLRDPLSWERRPEGAAEQLVLFNHGGREPGTQRWKVRAAVLITKYGRSLFHTGRCTPGQDIGWYEGTPITRTQYGSLTASTGLRYTLKVGKGYLNGMHGTPGMQYANTSRKGDPEANAELAGSGHDILAVREDAQVNRGTQIHCGPTVGQRPRGMR